MVAPVRHNDFLCREGLVVSGVLLAVNHEQLQDEQCTYPQTLLARRLQPKAVPVQALPGTGRGNRSRQAA